MDMPPSPFSVLVISAPPPRSLRASLAVIVVPAPSVQHRFLTYACCGHLPALPFRTLKVFKLQDFVEDLRWIKLETPSVSEAVTRTQSAWDRNEQLNVDEATVQHITGAEDNADDITDARIQVEVIKAGLANYEPIHNWPPESFWVRPTSY